MQQSQPQPQQPTTTITITNPVTTHPTLFQHLYQIYPDLPQYSLQHKTIQKYEYYLHRFTQLYGRQPTYFVKSPGRVCLLGEPHSGYSTVEFCVGRDVVVAVAVNGGQQVVVNNVDKTVFPEVRMPVGGRVGGGSQGKEGYGGNGGYGDVIGMALRVCAGVGEREKGKGFVSVGMEVFVFSDFLGKCKLGKNTALIYGLLLAFLTANKLLSKLTYTHLLQLLSKFKSTLPQITLTQSQLLSTNNHLLLLPSLTQLPFPKQYTFILAHSLTPEPTKLTEGKRNNLRICEILIGIELIKSQYDITREFRNMRELQENLGYETEDMINEVEANVPNKMMNADEIQKATNKSMIEILKSVPFANVVIDQNQTFHPFKRMMYLLKQQQLISKLTHLLSSSPQPTTLYPQLQSLLTQSHNHTKQYLEIGSSEIDRLIAIGLEQNLNCFKVIGNGWGGNVLFLVKKSEVAEKIDRLITRYYSEKENQIYMSNEVEEYVYEVVPSQGVSVLDPQYELWF